MSSHVLNAWPTLTVPLARATLTQDSVSSVTPMLNVKTEYVEPTFATIVLRMTIVKTTAASATLAPNVSPTIIAQQMRASTTSARNALSMNTAETSSVAQILVSNVLLITNVTPTLASTTLVSSVTPMTNAKEDAQTTRVLSVLTTPIAPITLLAVPTNALKSISTFVILTSRIVRIPCTVKQQLSDSDAKKDHASHLLTILNLSATDQTTVMMKTFVVSVTSRLKIVVEATLAKKTVPVLQTLVSDPMAPIAMDSICTAS
jgi:hypothetical protein